MYEFKTYRGVMCHDMKIVAKFEEELTFRFKIDMKDLSNFDSTTQKSKKLLFNGLLGPKYIMFELKRYRGSMFNGTEDWCKI